MDNQKIKIDFNDVNAWKLPAAMYFDSELEKDSIIVYSGFASEMPCLISGGECQVFNSIDAVAGYIKHHLIYDNIAYNILKMEYSTTADELEDEAFLMDIQDIWKQNVGAIGLLEYVEESHPDRWDEKLAELKSYIEAVSNTLDRIFECDDENEKRLYWFQQELFLTIYLQTLADGALTYSCILEQLNLQKDMRIDTTFQACSEVERNCGKKLSQVSLMMSTQRC